MGKKTKIMECVYCGKRKETTRDHVFSKNLFPKSYKKKNIITVPCCADCNKGFSRDEEYFRILLSGAGLERSQYADELFFSKVKRCIQRRPHIVSKLLNQMDLVDVYTGSGIYIGQRTRVSIPDDDWSRFCNVLTKYIKGLFFHTFKQILPLDYKVKHYWPSEERLGACLRYVNKWNFDNKEIVAYGYNSEPSTYESGWVTVFHGSIFFVSIVATDQRLKQIEKSELSTSA